MLKKWVRIVIGRYGYKSSFGANKDHLVGQLTSQPQDKVHNVITCKVHQELFLHVQLKTELFALSLLAIRTH